MRKKVDKLNGRKIIVLFNFLLLFYFSRVRMKIIAEHFSSINYIFETIMKKIHMLKKLIIILIPNR